MDLLTRSGAFQDDRLDNLDESIQGRVDAGEILLRSSRHSNAPTVPLRRQKTSGGSSSGWRTPTRFRLPRRSGRPPTPRSPEHRGRYAERRRVSGHYRPREWVQLVRSLGMLYNPLPKTGRANNWIGSFRRFRSNNAVGFESYEYSLSPGSTGSTNS